MSSFFALVTPINGFDGRPALPGQLPVFPPHPWFPGHLPGGAGSPDNSLPSAPVHPWLPPYLGGGMPDNSLPGGGGHPWLPGHLPPFGSTLPLPPTQPPGDGMFWALSQWGWAKVPDEYKPATNKPVEPPGASPK